MFSWLLWFRRPHEYEAIMVGFYGHARGCLLGAHVGWWWPILFPRMVFF